MLGSVGENGHHLSIGYYSLNIERAGGINRSTQSCPFHKRSEQESCCYCYSNSYLKCFKNLPRYERQQDGIERSLEVERMLIAPLNQRISEKCIWAHTICESCNRSCQWRANTIHLLYPQARLDSNSSLNRLGKSRFFEADLFQTALGAPCLVRPENPSLFLRRPSPSLVRFARAILSDKTKIRQFVYLRNVCMTSLISLILSKPDSKCISYFIANCTCS